MSKMVFCFPKMNIYLIYDQRRCDFLSNKTIKRYIDNEKADVVRHQMEHTQAGGKSFCEYSWEIGDICVVSPWMGQVAFRRH